MIVPRVNMEDLVVLRPLRLEGDIIAELKHQLMQVLVEPKMLVVQVAYVAAVVHWELVRLLVLIMAAAAAAAVIMAAAAVLMAAAAAEVISLAVCHL